MIEGRGHRAPRMTVNRLSTQNHARNETNRKRKRKLKWQFLPEVAIFICTYQKKAVPLPMQKKSNPKTTDMRIQDIRALEERISDN